MQAEADRIFHRASSIIRWLFDRWKESLPYLLAVTVVIATLDILSFSFEDAVTFRRIGRSLFQAFVYNNFFGAFISASFALCDLYPSARGKTFKWLLLAAGITVAMSLGLVLGTLLLVGVGWFRPDEFFIGVKRSLAPTVSLGLIIGISIYLYESMKERLEATTLELRTRQLEEERARKLAIAARLESLESRVRPHFLFNTLNSISALTHEDPERAERMVDLLSALLRFSLDAGQRATVPLRDEVKIVSDYLEIERVRFGERLRFDVALPVELEQTSVPPFALQTLVENSLKHGIAPRRAGGEVRVTAKADGEAVRLEVRDDGPGFTADAITAGHGLDNLQARLKTLFGDQAALGVERAEPFTEVSISLPRNSQTEAGCQ
ncbi:MAG: sensor histidine kinase [Blastocatellia bacterium]